MLRGRGLGKRLGCGLRRCRPMPLCPLVLGTAQGAGRWLCIRVLRAARLPQAQPSPAQPVPQELSRPPSPSVLISGRQLLGITLTEWFCLPAFSTVSRPRATDQRRGCAAQGGAGVRIRGPSPLFPRTSVPIQHPQGPHRSPAQPRPPPATNKVERCQEFGEEKWRVSGLEDGE